MTKFDDPVPFCYNRTLQGCMYKDGTLPINNLRWLLFCSIRAGDILKILTFAAPNPGLSTWLTLHKFLTIKLKFL